MSYILDALRKADQMRRDGVGPSLGPFLDPPAHAPRDRKGWISMLVVLTFAGGILLGSVFKWSGDKSTATGETTIPSSSRPSSAGPRPAESRTPSARRDDVSRLPPATGSPVGGNGERAGGNAPTQLPTPQQSSRPARTRESTVVKEAGVVGSAIPEADDLPPGIRRALPTFSVGMHAYSTVAESRLASVNGVLLQEGNDLAPGLRLETITPNGMVFVYQGHRFRVDVQR